VVTDASDKKSLRMGLNLVTNQKERITQDTHAHGASSLAGERVSIPANAPMEKSRA
jgi:hypothetical protein